MMRSIKGGVNTVEENRPLAMQARAGAAHRREPKVSICIPAFQAERHLPATIDSALAQTYANLEIVIVNNNSSDGTTEILEMLNDDRVRVIRNDTTLPMIDNFNLAIRQSNGEFVKLVCADDLMEPDCIAAQAAVLQRFPDVTLVSARTDFIDGRGKLLRPARGLPGLDGRRDCQRVARQIVRCGTNPIGPPVAAMFRRADFDRCGGFGTDLPFVNELDLWVRLLRNGDFFGEPRTLASFRIYSSSVTSVTSARSQLAQQIEFARRLSDDPRWTITIRDRIWGRVNCYDMQLRRTALYSISTLRDSISTLRASRRSRRITGSIAAGNRLPNFQALRSAESSGPSTLPTRTAVISLASDLGATACQLPATDGQCDADRAVFLTVVICAYTTRRWADLCRAVESVLAQDRPALEIILVIDHCDELFLRTCSRFGKDDRVTVRQNTEAPGLSGARNTGVAAANGDVVAFLDDDAAAEPGWARTLMRHYQDRRVASVGGYAVPIWPHGRPAWMPKEFDWVVGCSYVGQPTHLAPVRNPIGCNMSLRRSVLGVVGGFSSELGRIGSLPVGCEETELCIRIRANQPSSQILLDPEAVVRHRISRDRTTLRYFIQRCHREGMSKAIVTELANTPKTLGTERVYAFYVLPRAVLREGLSMSPDGLARAAVMLFGLAVTTAGYVQAKAGRWLRRRTS